MKFIWTQDRLDVFITNVLNNPKDFTVDEVVKELTNGNYLICKPQNLNRSQYNWLCGLLKERYQELLKEDLVEPPKQF